jgi:hypothetical protein
VDQRGEHDVDQCEHTLIYCITNFRLVEPWMCDFDIEIDTTLNLSNISLQKLSKKKKKSAQNFL